MWECLSRDRGVRQWGRCPPPTPSQPTECVSGLAHNHENMQMTQAEHWEAHFCFPFCMIRLTLALVPLPWEHNSGSLLENETSEAELNWLHCSSWGLRHLRAQLESPKPPCRHTIDHRHMSEPSQIQLRSVPACSQPEHSWEKNHQLLFPCTVFWGGLLYSDSWQMQVGRRNTC